MQAALAEIYPGESFPSARSWSTAPGSAATGTGTRPSRSTTRLEIVRSHKDLALAKYLQAVRKLSDRLSQSRHYVGISEELEQSLQADAAALPDVAAEAAGRSADGAVPA